MLKIYFYSPTKDSTMLATIYHGIPMMLHDTVLWTMIHRSEIPRGNSFLSINAQIAHLQTLVFAVS